jgi:hypothetical protein
MIATEEGYLRGGEQETDRDDKTITLEFEGKSEEDEFRGILFIPSEPLMTCSKPPQQIRQQRIIPLSCMSGESSSSLTKIVAEVIVDFTTCL